MLSSNHFYYRLIRKYVILFGNMFNNISVVRYLSDNETEVRRFKVPLVYGPKDHFVTRLESDPDLLREFQTALPRMSFEIPASGINYDSSRKQNALLRTAKGDTATGVTSSYMGVPYNIDFELSIYTKTIDDGNHILEQILPYFNPDYTVTITPVPELGFLKDIPIILNNVTQDIRYEGPSDSIRMCIWNLSFTVKGYFFGPTSTPKIIRKSIANIFNDPSLVAGNIVRVNLSGGNNGTFQIRDVVYQGKNYETATAYGYVNDWSYDTKKLVIGGAQGTFKVNQTIRGFSSNASYNIGSFVSTPLKLASVTVEPDPIDAEPGDDFGYSVSILEWPDTET